MEVNVHTEHQVVQYFYSKKKLNAHQVLWYLHISEFPYNIHDRPVTKMGKPDGQARRSVEENSRMAGKFLQVAYLLNLVEDENNNECNQDEIELDGIDVTNCDKRKALWLVPEEHRVEVVR